MLRQIQKIRADLSEQMLNSGYFITILHKIRENIQLPPLRRKASALYAYASWLPRSNDWKPSGMTLWSILGNIRAPTAIVLRIRDMAEEKPMGRPTKNQKYENTK
jgi:hypothetical protein